MGELEGDNDATGKIVGLSTGTCEGISVGTPVNNTGLALGKFESDTVGSEKGTLVGTKIGDSVGATDGEKLGLNVGDNDDGFADGDRVGFDVGTGEGLIEAMLGLVVGDLLANVEGCWDGLSLGTIGAIVGKKALNSVSIPL